MSASFSAPASASRLSLPRPDSQSPSETATVVDEAAISKNLKSKPASIASRPTTPPPAHTHGVPDAAAEAGFSDIVRNSTIATLPPDVKLTQTKKWSLLALFSMAFFVDIWSYSAFFIFTDPIATNLKVPFGEQSWVITSYAVTFSAFLLFWGRVSDLYSAKPVFAFGFLALGILDLIISFLPDRFSFFVLRAVSGIAGSALIPAAYRLIVAVFEPHELGKALTIYGMSGALANVTGVLVAGFVEYIPTHGQGEAWRWFFRILAILIVPFALASLTFIPKPRGMIAHVDGKWKRLDLVGSFSMLVAIVLLILGLTLGASYGFKTAKFLVPFLLTWPVLAFFFVWEAKIPEDYAVVPPKIWRIPNLTLFIVFALYIYGWWAVNFLALIERWLAVHNEKPIIAAVRALPQGLAAMGVTVLLTVFPVLVSRPRWPITVGMLLAITGYVLFSRGNQIGSDYWKFIFPASIIGSGGMMATFTGTNVGIITSVPAEYSGTTGALSQVAFQVGSAVALSIQAGLFTVNPGSISNQLNIQTSFYFQIGWGIVWLIGFLVFYRPKKNAVSSDQDGAEQGEPKRPVIAH